MSNRIERTESDIALRAQSIANGSLKLFSRCTSYRITKFPERYRHRVELHGNPHEVNSYNQLCFSLAAPIASMLLARGSWSVEQAVEENCKRAIIAHFTSQIGLSPLDYSEDDFEVALIFREPIPVVA